MYHVNTVLTNSKFHKINRPALMIKNSYSLRTSHIFIINCTFELTTAGLTIRIFVSSFNKTVSFINCKFHSNQELIVITTEACRTPNDCELIVTNAIMSTNILLTNISFIKCQFIGNRNRILLIEYNNLILSNLKANVLLESLFILNNYVSAVVL